MKALKFFLFLAFLIGSLLIHGFVFLCFWNWFFIPLGLPTLSYTTCIGVIFFLNWILHNSSKEYENFDIKKLTADFLSLISTAILILIIGFIIYLLQ
jgi:type IV secretory pathway TraG/TraD family ATPase VirD4